MFQTFCEYWTSIASRADAQNAERVEVVGGPGTCVLREYGDCASAESFTIMTFLKGSNQPMICMIAMNDVPLRPDIQIRVGNPAAAGQSSAVDHKPTFLVFNFVEQVDEWRREVTVSFNAGRGPHTCCLRCDIRCGSTVTKCRTGCRFRLVISRHHEPTHRHPRPAIGNSASAPHPTISVPQRQWNTCHLHQCFTDRAYQRTHIRLFARAMC